MNTRQKIFYLFVFALFALEAGVVALHAERLVEAPLWFWVLAGLAAYRTARTITYNGVGEPLRERWTVVEPDGSGAGDTVNANPRLTGASRGLGELLACPICTGTHAAMALVSLYTLVPTFGLALVAGLGVAGLAEVIHWYTEAAEWRAHTERERCGEFVRTRQERRSIPEILEREIRY